MVFDVFGLGSGKLETTGSKDDVLDALSISAFLLSNELEGFLELGVGNPSFWVIFHFSKNEINVGCCEFFVNKAAVFCQFDEGLSFHGLLCAVHWVEHGLKGVGIHLFECFSKMGELV